MALRERLVYAIDFTTDRATTGLQNLRRSIAEAEGATGKLKAGWKSAVAEFKNSRAAQAAVGAAAVAAAKVAIDAASDLEESVNAVQKSYGLAADDILALGDTAVDAFGMSRRAWNEFATQFSGFANDIADRSGRKVVDVMAEIGQRTADFASVHNISLEEASQVMRSSLAGETEALRRYGGDISAATVKTYAYANGIADVGSELTESQKVLARYGVLLDETSNVAGDFADTSDSYANSQKRLGAQVENLSASLGQVLVPAVAQSTDALVDLAQAIEAIGNVPGMSEIAWFSRTAQDAYGALLAPVQLFNRETKDTPSLLDDVTDAVVRYTKAEQENAAEARILAEFERDKARAHEHTTTTLMEARRAQEQSTRATEEATRAARDASRAIQQMDTAHQRLMRQLSNDDALIDVQMAFRDLGEDATAALNDGTNATLEQQRALIELKQRVAAYGSEVLHLPDQYLTVITSLIDEGRLAEAERRLNALARSRYVPIRPSVTSGGISQYFADGTDFAPGGLAVVGEEGPELVDLPRGSRVHTASETRDMLSGGGGDHYTVNVNMRFEGLVTDPAAVGREVQRALNAFERQGGR